MIRWLRLISVLSVPLALGLGMAWAAEQAPAAKDTAAFAPCATCHDDVAAQFVGNPHAHGVATTAGAGKAVCESCHGDGTQHSDEGNKALIKVPSGAPGSKSCLGCHQGKPGFDRAAHGFHASAAVSCSNCHTIHGAKSGPALLRAAVSTDLCVSCHPAQRRLFDKAYAHRLTLGGMECVSCHNPHGGSGERSLKTTAAGELPCLSCHTEKQGPYVFSHVNGIAGNCMTCHEPHGSNNAKMLTRARLDRLCLECHTTLPAGTLGPQPPSFHDLRSPRYTNCTVCHVAIHGSNSSPMLLK